jgi:hypothetical protein
MLDTTTGEVVKKTLKHESNDVREFYSNLPATGACGNRSHGINAVVVNLMKELGSECGGDRFGEHHIFGISSTNFLTTEEYACLAGRVMIRPC